MNKEKVEKIGLVIVLILGLAYAYNTYLFSPKWEVLQKVKGQLIERQQHYDQLVSFQQNKSDLAKTIESISGEADDLSAKIPPRLDNPQIMVDIYTTANSYGVSPQTLQFEQLQNKGSFESLGMMFTCKGNVENVLNLITDLEYTPLQKISVQSVTLTAQKASNPTNFSQPSGTVGLSSPIITPTVFAPVPALGNQLTKVTAMDATKIIADGSPVNSVYPSSNDQVQGGTSSIEDSSNQLIQGGKTESLSADLSPVQVVVTAQIKLTAYASSLGTANVNGPNPPFMSAQFGVNSAAEMFK